MSLFRLRSRSTGFESLRLALLEAAIPRHECCVQELTGQATALCAWTDKNLPEGDAVFDLPDVH